jgi:hypothetical protein
MNILTTEYWIVFQLFIDFVLILIIFYFLRNLKTRIRVSASREVVEQVAGVLEPLLNEADSTAKAFERQLKEKNRLIKELNEKLDTRIISLNLLLNRSAAYLSAENRNTVGGSGHVYEQQASIIELYEKGHSAEDIAGKLSMPKGEVDLVLDLKKKFLKMK